MWLRAISLVVLASLAAGCGSGGGDVDGSQFACPGGLTRPFSVETLIRVAREDDVSLKRDPDCGGDQQAVELASNMVNGGDDEVDAREGHVICHVADLPFAKPPFRVRRTKYPDDQETRLDVANVDCAIYPSAAGQIERLQSALRALAKALVEQRSCPKAHAQPVTVARLIAAAKRKGVRLLPDARCIEPGVVAQASTILPYALDKSDEDKVFYDQGEVTCLVREAAVPGAKEIKTTNLSVGKRFDLLNVSCTVKTSPERETAQVKRVRAALDELDRSPGGP